MLHNIQIDNDQLKVLDKVLRKGIYEEVAPVIDAINVQLRAALRAQEAAEFQRAQEDQEAAEANRVSEDNQTAT